MKWHRATRNGGGALWDWPLAFALAAWLLAAPGVVGDSAAAANQSATDERSPSDVPAASVTDPTPIANAKSAKSNVCSTFRVREQDQVWVVSTRHLGCVAHCQSLPSLQIWRYESGWWQPKSATAFLDEQPGDAVTSFYIHGNQIGHPQACSDGLAVYFQMVGKLDDEPPVRFVIWSWPSEKIKGPINDARTKAARSDTEAQYLAHFLEDLTPNVQVGLLGYSLGARIVSGAMHQIGSQTPQAGSDEPSRFRVALWAAAEHNHWYLPGNYHQHALATADAWFITINGCDHVLGRYRFIEKCSDPSAVGYCGIYGRNLLLPDVNARIEEVNVANIVGNDHNMPPYLYSLWIQNRTREYVLWHPLVGAQVSGEVAAIKAN